MRRSRHFDTCYRTGGIPDCSFVKTPSIMFGLFKKKDPREALEKQYKDLLAEAHRLSTLDRKASDLKRAEAEEVIKAIERLPKQA